MISIIQSVQAAGVIEDAPTIAQVLTNALNFFLMFVGFVAVIAFIVLGVLILTAAGSPKILEQAKRAFTYSIVGIVVALGSLILIRLMSVILEV